jgi:hypothetical protein
MKNIHVIATDKPSRLYLSDYGKELNLSAYPLRNYTTGQHIYITNSEEIKIGDYYYLPRTNSVYKCIEDSTELNLERRLGVAKIIITTDQDLIKDGVQAIDDEFLEWFVKNNSFEFVEVNKMSYGYLSGFAHAGYKIIIPKEETQIMSFDEYLERSDELLNRHREEPKQHVDLINSNIDEFDKALELSKQKTLEKKLEKAAKSYRKTTPNQMYGDELGFISGAKWQQERSYSEEEVEFIKRLADFYWSNYNNEHPNNLKDFELTKSILETFKKK